MVGGETERGKGKAAKKRIYRTPCIRKRISEK